MCLDIASGRVTKNQRAQIGIKTKFEFSIIFTQTSRESSAQLIVYTPELRTAGETVIQYFFRSSKMMKTTETQSVDFDDFCLAMGNEHDGL
jgi:hypothetical protein